MGEPNLILESRRLCGELERLLPEIHFPRRDATFPSSSGTLVTVKLPTKLAASAGALAWRAHDFATLACDLFDAKRVVPGAIMARSLVDPDLEKVHRDEQVSAVAAPVLTILVEECCLTPHGRVPAS